MRARGGSSGMTAPRTSIRAVRAAGRGLRSVSTSANVRDSPAGIHSDCGLSVPSDRAARLGELAAERDVGALGPRVFSASTRTKVAVSAKPSPTVSVRMRGVGRDPDQVEVELGAASRRRQAPVAPAASTAASDEQAGATHRRSYSAAAVRRRCGGACRSARGSRMSSRTLGGTSGASIQELGAAGRERGERGRERCATRSSRGRRLSMMTRYAPFTLHSPPCHDAGLERLVADADPELVGGLLEELEQDFWLHDQDPHYQDRSIAQPFCPQTGRHGSSRSRRDLAGRACPACAPRSHRRQDDAKRGTAEIGASHGDLAAVLLDDVADDRQAEAGALAVGLGREERLEDPLAVGLGDARAGVGDLDQDRARGRRRCARTTTLPPLSTAWTALVIRLIRTCSSWPATAWITGSSGSTSTASVDAAALDEVLADRHRLPHDRRRDRPARGRGPIGRAYWTRSRENRRMRCALAPIRRSFSRSAALGALRPRACARGTRRRR